MPKLYGYLADQNLLFLQNLAGRPLDKISWKDWYTDLADCKNSVIFVSDVDINNHFDLTKKLLDQNNFFVIVNLHESNDTMQNRIDACRDLPALRDFPTVNGSSVRRDGQFGIDSFLFKIFDLNNVLRAEWIGSHYTTQRPFNFLFLNGKHRDHRSQLWQTLEQHGLLSHSLNSYLGFHPSASSDILPSLLPIEYESKYINLDQYCPTFVKNSRNSQNFKQGLWQSQWLDGQLDPINRFTDTYFSLVTETEVDADRCFFITEKTFKPLLAGHPFIVLGQPGLYDYIKHLGFKTFSSVIDESFDHEPSIEKRIDMIANEVRRICAMDLTMFADQCQSICDHNRSHYRTLVSQHFSYINQEFEKWIIAVLAQAESYVSD